MSMGAGTGRQPCQLKSGDGALGEVSTGISPLKVTRGVGSWVSHKRCKTFHMRACKGGRRGRRGGGG